MTTTALQAQYRTFTEDTNLTIIRLSLLPLPLQITRLPRLTALPRLVFFICRRSLSIGWQERRRRTMDARNVGPWRRCHQSATGVVGLAAVPGFGQHRFPVRSAWQTARPRPTFWGQVSCSGLVTGPDWVSFATNLLLTASAPVNVFFNQSAPPTGTNSDDEALALGSSAGTWVLKTNAAPGLNPGSTTTSGCRIQMREP